MATEVRRLLAGDAAGELAALAGLLVDCVAGGASVGFLDGLTAERAAEWWSEVARESERDGRAILVARGADGRACGVVLVIPARMENQPHRADVSKLLVHRSARRAGVGEALMRAAEREARGMGRTVLTLDTATPEAARLYERLGWTRAGVFPDYALMPDGALCDTILYYKRI
jgi:ribosomal protein S18 acetylase RimI-like enzyme